MYADESLVEQFVTVALKAMQRSSAAVDVILEALPAPTYVTDPSGAITHFNWACIPFAGRTPVVGQDRWCVTWQLYKMDGAFLPHDQCPMAQAILQKRAIRGAVAIAMRPDGTREVFKPFPTPLLDDDGNLVGAVNVFLDLTTETEIVELKRHAQDCRRIAAGITDDVAAAALDALADECDASVRALENPN